MAKDDTAGPDGILRSRIRTLTDEQHALRTAGGTPDHARLAELEREIDQSWDLIRQRDAKRAVGADPDQARERPQGEVEGYLQ